MLTTVKSQVSERFQTGYAPHIALSVRVIGAEFETTQVFVKYLYFKRSWVILDRVTDAQICNVDTWLILRTRIYVLQLLAKKRTANGVSLLVLKDATQLPNWPK